MFIFRLRLFFLAAITLVALLGANACTRASGSAPLPPPPAGSTSWPPATDRIVNLDGQEEDIVPLERRGIYVVPVNRWLVVTDFTAVVDGAERINLGEVFAGELRIRLGYLFLGNLVHEDLHAFHSTTGLVFRPGSVVVLASTNTLTNINDDVRYNLVGYLADL